VSNNRSKYGRNRQLWRKVYGPRRRKPETTSYVDIPTQKEITIDLHRTLRHRDFYIVKSSFNKSNLTLAEFDEGLIAFTGGTSATANFKFCFSSTPDAVVLTVDAPGDSSEYIIPYGITFNSCSMSIGLSAPFNGNIRYRAAYSSTGYPALVTSSLAPSTVLRIAAGQVTASLPPVTAYTASFGTLIRAPSNFFRTTWDELSTFDNDVNLTLESSTTSGAIGEISAPLGNPIYFIAIQ